MTLRHLTYFPRDYSQLTSDDFENRECKTIFKQLRKFSNAVTSDELLLSLPDRKTYVDTINQIYELNNSNPDYWLTELMKCSVLRSLKREGKTDLLQDFIVESLLNGEPVTSWSDWYINASINDIRDKIQDSYENVLSCCRCDYDLQVINVADIEDSRMDWIVEDLFCNNSINNVIAPSKSGKSFFVHQLAWSILNGIDFLGMKIQNPSEVIICDFEMQLSDLKQKYNSVTADFGAAKGYDVLPAFGKNAVDVCNAVRERKKKNPNLRVAIFDCYYKFKVRDENSATDVSASLAPLNELARDMCVIYVHHTTLNGTKRGSNAINSGSGSSVHGRNVSQCVIINSTDSNGNCSLCISGRYVPSGTITLQCHRTEHGCFALGKNQENDYRHQFHKRKTVEELLEEYPELCAAIGSDGITMSKLRKDFPGESISTLKSKRFWYSGKNRRTDGIPSDRFYLQEPHQEEVLPN